MSRVLHALLPVGYPWCKFCRASFPLHLALDRCAAISEGGQELHELLKDTNRKLKVSAGLPDWKNYVDFFNSLVGLKTVPYSETVGKMNRRIFASLLVARLLCF